MKLKPLNITFLTFVMYFSPLLWREVGGEVQAQNIYTAVGSGTNCVYSGDGGPAYLAETCTPQGLASDATGNVYFCDLGNRCIRKINSAGIITTVAGIGGSFGWSGDGGQATSAQLAGPVAINFDALGNLYITDVGCHCVRKVNTSGIITTIAGVGGPIYSGDGGPASSAGLHTPKGVAVDASGNVYISDWGNSCIRKINTSGIISTIAGDGMPGYSGDGGPASLAKLNYPYGIALDALGNLYIADKTNARIRKIDVSGIINTVAGTVVAGYNGDGIPATTARIMNPEGIKLDALGNLYFVEAGGQRVRKVNTSGIISTIAGIGPPSGYSGDGGLATLAQFYQPNDMTFDGVGNIYISDPGSNSIRIICNTSCLSGINEIENKNNFLIYPNPVSNTLYISSETNEFKDSEIEIINCLGQKVLKSRYKNEIDVSSLASGCYLLKITTAEKRQFHSKFIKE